MSRPSVTFAVFSYNQERFVREAIESAFAQTFQPMEILLTDDCSTDRSFEIMEQMAAAYRGPNRVVLNRNPTNLGVGAHVNRVMELATGELLVGAAGDDISLPERTEVMVDQFQKSQGKLTSLYTATIAIDDQSRVIGRFFDPPKPRNKADLPYRVTVMSAGIHGASHTFNRKTFEVFGPLRNDVIAEDRAIAFRAYELGEVEYLDQPLVLYRTHDTNLCGQDYGKFDAAAHRRRCLSKAQWAAAANRQFLDDMQHPLFQANYSAEVLAEAREIAQNSLRHWELEKQFVTASRLGRFGVVARAAAAGIPPRRTMKWLARSVLPERAYYEFVVKRHASMTDIVDGDLELGNGAV